MELIDRLLPYQLTAVTGLLEAMLDRSTGNSRSPKAATSSNSKATVSPKSASISGDNK